MDLSLCIYGLVFIFSVCNGHGGHGGHGGSEDATRPDKEHIKEHLKEEAEMDLSKMTQEELEFYYFKLHDTDNNTALDGLEMFKAVRHQYDQSDFHPEGQSPPPKTHEEAVQKSKEMEQQISKTVDQFFVDVDQNNDGLITFIEYKVHMAAIRHGTDNQAQKDKM